MSHLTAAAAERPVRDRAADPLRDLAGGDVLTIGDLPAPAVEALLDDAAERKATRRSPWPAARPLAGRAVALLFERPSLRTRVSFELAVRELGGEAIHLSGAEIGLGTRETIDDVGSTLDRYLDAVVARIVRHRDLEALARASAVPVVNALSDLEHPCQALADLLTLRERFGRLDGLTLAFVGDANNVFVSLARAALPLGVEVRIAHPEDHGPAAAELAPGGALAGVRAFADPRQAVRGADAVYTDVWASIGQEAEASSRAAVFAPFRLDAALLALAPHHAVAMHCLPAHRGEEISGDVLDGPRSLAWEQAANRLHVQKAVLAALLADR